MAENKNCDNNCAKKTSIGGQALIEGIMMKGPHKTTMAVRNPKGEIVLEDVEFKAAKEKYKILGVPIIRGVVGFIESMLSGYKTLMRSAEIAGEIEDEELSPFEEKMIKLFGDKLWNGLMVIAAILGVGLAFVLFMWLPTQLYTWFSDLLNLPSGADEIKIVRSAFEGIIKIVIFVIYIALCSRMNEIKRVYQYHGAEHKSIFCYEKGLPLTVENIKKQSRFHPRCGTSFLILMLILGIIAGLFVPVFTAYSTFVNSLLRALCRIAILPIVMGVGYELLKLCGRYDNIFTRIISAPGLWMQRLTTKEPDDSQIECAIAALEAVIPENSEDDRW